mmetsp:Transcript_5378/g.11810  ORF Transcript_5378/g.11810 Transcript_5378/m.11810 type:complete len:300 (+) Transcript_5378:177-1076(+)
MLSVMSGAAPLPAGAACPPSASSAALRVRLTAVRPGVPFTPELFCAAAAAATATAALAPALLLLKVALAGCCCPDVEAWPALCFVLPVLMPGIPAPIDVAPLPAFAAAAFCFATSSGSGCASVAAPHNRPAAAAAPGLFFARALPQGWLLCPEVLATGSCACPLPAAPGPANLSARFPSSSSCLRSSSTLMPCCSAMRLSSSSSSSSTPSGSFMGSMSNMSSLCSSLGAGQFWLLPPTYTFLRPDRSRLNPINMLMSTSRDSSSHVPTSTLNLAQLPLNSTSLMSCSREPMASSTTSLL